MSEIILQLSPMFFTGAVCCEEPNVGKTSFNLFEIALDKNFALTFNNDTGLQSQREMPW